MIELAAVAHIDPRGEESIREIDRKYPQFIDGAGGPARVVCSGEPVLVCDIDHRMMAEHARDAEHARLLRLFGLRSVMILPMRTRGRTIGCVSFVMGPSGP